MIQSKFLLFDTGHRELRFQMHVVTCIYLALSFNLSHAHSGQHLINPFLKEKLESLVLKNDYHQNAIKEQILP
jgi:hypothetical protein